MQAMMMRPRSLCGLLMHNDPKSRKMSGFLLFFCRRFVRHRDVRKGADRIEEDAMVDPERTDHREHSASSATLVRPLWDEFSTRLVGHFSGFFFDSVCCLSRSFYVGISTNLVKRVGDTVRNGNCRHFNPS